MALALLSFAHLFAPLQALWATTQRARAPVHHRPQPMTRAVAPKPCTTAPSRVPARNLRPLRVMRVLDPGQARDGAGRMVISGRMADVCAELDRLAAREAQGRAANPQVAAPTR